MPPKFSLLAISDRRSLPLEPWLRALATAAIGAVQIREKDLEDGALYDLARLARTALPSSTRLLINGRVDVALAAGADGVHLPSDGLPVAALRQRFGPGVLLGRSTHRVEEVERARDEGADYVTFGPVYPTPGKGPPVGLGELGRAAAAGLPVYALGGVTLERFGELAGAGAAGVAAIRLFQKTSDLTQVARAARENFGRP
ncbi:MAG TPA: thiamine phosphate synthase [Thermoanaerobaculia bacterium]|nr:thiamine phosphate synthase [Thermoanaerobaculia bacterium]